MGNLYPCFNRPKAAFTKQSLVLMTQKKNSRNVFYTIKNKSKHFEKHSFCLLQFALNLVKPKILLFDEELTHSQTSPGFYMSAV